MGVFFTVGEKKKRPGVYQRYENTGGVSVAGATNGIVACVVRADWGALKKVHTFESIDAAKAALGSGGTVDIINQIFTGGATKVYCVRLGVGGVKGVKKLMDDQDTAVVSMAAKQEGSREFSFTIRSSISDPAMKECIIYENSGVVEKLAFAAGGNEGESLAAAGAASKYFDFALEEGYEGAGVLANVTQEAFPKGENPAITANDYSEAFLLLEPYSVNAICVDTADVAVHTLLGNFVERIYNNGNILPFAVVGEPVSVDFETRLSHAKAFNAYNVVYVGSGAIDTAGGTLEGPQAAARVAGMIAATASNQSLTHKVVTGMVDVTEMLTNSQYEQAIDAGMLTFSVSASGAVWIESGVTTMTTLQGENDEGWKKIKRTKIRKELMDRASSTVEPLVGNINNDEDGRATILIAIDRLLALMATEGKLLEGAYVEVDSGNPPEGDSAWFNIYADDIDSLEKMYFVYKFRYAPM